jgi:hypothetical protein
MRRGGRGELALIVALAGLAAAACESQKPEDAWWTKVKSPTYAGDSARVVRLATHALGDSLPMRVESVTKGAEGWFVRLLPVRGGLPGGGTVYVQLSDSSATVVKRY